MTKFEKEYFKKLDFSKEEIDRYFQNAKRDLEIARQDSFSEVQFTYSYQALMKAGIALLAKTGSVKVRSIPGHHIKILEKIEEILQDSDILTLGNAMRMKRNLDLYGGGESISQKEATDYLKFVESVFKKIEIRIKD